ncbi:exocyst complex component EXO70H1-like [Momordica charantia]|uniref:Exocyst subunit Exo70 family protein n=1 Tax=Momordica charantia TaxID=3673 RepID=A0A6J1CRV6_MOMCH|nr:exocyst complex component EXO70H1-like [Momordica charantia]
MPKNGKKIFGICSRILSPLVSPYSNSSSSSSDQVVVVPRRRFSESMIDQSLESAAEMIGKWSTESLAYAEVTSMFHESNEEALRFIQCVNDLQKVMYLLASQTKLVFCHSLMQIAMKRLQVEFYRILSVKRELFEAESSITAGDYDPNSVKIISSGAVADLRTIAECMISCGYTKECVEIYSTLRKSVVDEGIYRLGVVKLSSQIRKMDVEAVDFRVKKWLEAVSIAISTLFNAERVVCDHVFGTSESVRESCFTRTCEDSAMILFAFPQVIVKSKKSPKNLFYMLDMFTAIFENWPRIESIFSIESTEVVRSQAIASLDILAESISTMLLDYKSFIPNESSKSPSTDGGIDALALESMDYLTLLAEYREILRIIFDRWPPPGNSSFPGDSSSDTPNSDDSPVSTISSHIARLIFILLCKIDCKARQYEDISLSYLFLANNVRFIIWKVHSSELHHLLREEWIAKHKAKVNQYIENYRRLAWGKVISSLPENPTAALSTAEVAEVYENFNSSFKEAYRKQRSGTVPDPELRVEIFAIARTWLPAYREFYQAHRVPVGQEVITRLTPEDVENYLSYLFFPREESNSLPNQQNPFR